MKRNAGSLNDRLGMENDDGGSDAVLKPETELKRVLPRDLNERLGTLAEQRAVVQTKMKKTGNRTVEFILYGRIQNGILEVVDGCRMEGCGIW